MVISWPELEVSVPVVAPLLSTKSRSLIAWITLVGFASKFTKVILIEPALVVNVADASTA